MTEEERAERINLIRGTGIVVMVVMALMSMCMVIMGVTVSSVGESRFTMFMLSAGAGALTVIATGFTLLRIDKIKSRGGLMAGGACMIVSILAMLILALIALLGKF